MLPFYAVFTFALRSRVWRSVYLHVPCIGCTTKEIRDRFKKLALKWHPDKNIDNPDDAQKVCMYGAWLVFGL